MVVRSILDMVLGATGPEFDHAALSRVVELMLDGVPVIAMRGGLTWASAKGIRIDTRARSLSPTLAGELDDHETVQAKVEKAPAYFTIIGGVGGMCRWP